MTDIEPNLCRAATGVGHTSKMHKKDHIVPLPPELYELSKYRPGLTKDARK